MPIIVVKKRKLNVPKSSKPTQKVKPKKRQLTMEEKRAKLALQQAAKKQRLRKEARLTFMALGEKWPHIFSPEATTIPLKVGIRNDVIAAMSEYKAQKVRSALKHYFNIVRKEYLRLLVAGGPRFDLEGNECGSITEREQEVARTQLEGLAKTTLDKV